MEKTKEKAKKDLRRKNVRKKNFSIFGSNDLLLETHVKSKKNAVN